MPLKIEGLLSAAEVARLRELLAKVKFEDGRATAGTAVRDAKHNLQSAAADPSLEEPRQLLGSALLRNEQFTQVVLPNRVLPPMFNRYEVGMDYGGHVDNAIMGGATPLRADLSITVFLTDPADYDGGELVVQSDGEPQRIKLGAGSAVVYNSTSIHKVEKVTRGSRLCGVTWAQSYVRDEQRREMLFELTQLARWARGVAPGSQEAMKISKLRANLMRLWAEV